MQGRLTTQVVVFRPRTAYPPSDAQNDSQINATGWIIGIPSTGWPVFATTPTRGGSSPSPYLRPRKCNMSLPGRRCSQVITVIFPCKLEAQLVGTLRDTGRREVRSAEPAQPWPCWETFMAVSMPRHCRQRGLSPANQQAG